MLISINYRLVMQTNQISTTRPRTITSPTRRTLALVDVESRLIEKFEAQDITPDIVQTLSDIQLFELGVTTLRKRQVIRSLWSESSAGNGKQVAFFIISLIYKSSLS